MKVALNKCFGGFQLSPEAYDFLKLPWDGHGTAFADYEMRTNSELIKCIETLGEAASGKYGEVVVVNIPDDVVWTICDYDGIETAEEVHRIW